MILAARAEGSLAEVLIIAAVLSLQDPRERPMERAGAADAAQLKFGDEKSDFLSWLKLWKFYQEALAHKKSNRKLAELCRENFLSYNRMREWLDIHRQLHTFVAELGWKVSGKDATYEQIHRALLAGLLGNIGCKSEDSEHYLGARGIKFLIHPGSGVGKKAGRWIMAAEITETTRVYARCIARIEPEWLESIGAHLIRRHQYEPHWEKKPARVAAFDRDPLRHSALRQPEHPLRSSGPGRIAQDFHAAGAGRGRVRNARAVFRAQPQADPRYRDAGAQIAPPRRTGGRGVDLRLLRQPHPRGHPQRRRLRALAARRRNGQP